MYWNEIKIKILYNRYEKGYINEAFEKYLKHRVGQAAQNTASKISTNSFSPLLPNTIGSLEP